MRCPSCDAEVAESEIACPECGAALPSAEGEVTARIEPPQEPIETRDLGSDDDGDRDPQGADATASARRPAWARPFRALRRELAAGGWRDAVSAASVGFLSMLLVGAVLIVAAKLHAPDLGSGASPLSVIKAIVIVSLGTLGVPIDFDGLEVSAIPLGGLVAEGLMIAWAARTVVARRAPDDLRALAVDGAKVGLPFGLLCGAAALIFRLGGDHPVAADAGAALVLGWLWGAFWGALGGLVAHASLKQVLRRGLGALKARRPAVHEGVMTALVMLIAMSVLAVAAGLIWAIISLAGGGPSGRFGAADALASVVYVVAFSINVVASIVALSLGASIEVGHQITEAGRVLGSVREYSLWEWGSGATPWFVLPSVAIPVFATLIGGLSARRNTGSSRNAPVVLGTAALLFAVTIGLLAWLGEARLGAGLVRERGFARIAPDVWATTGLALVWAAGGSAAGWALGGFDRLARRRRRE